MKINSNNDYYKLDKKYITQKDSFKKSIIIQRIMKSLKSTLT